MITNFNALSLESSTSLEMMLDWSHSYSTLVQAPKDLLQKLLAGAACPAQPASQCTIMFTLPAPCCVPALLASCAQACTHTFAALGPHQCAGSIRAHVQTTATHTTRCKCVRSSCRRPRKARSPPRSRTRRSRSCTARRTSSGAQSLRGTQQGGCGWHRGTATRRSRGCAAASACRRCRCAGWRAQRCEGVLMLHTLDG